MYATHFGLDGPLFRSGVAQDETLLVGDPDAYADLTTHARIALSTPDAAIVLLGPPGVGKTTQAGAVLRAVMGSARAAVVWLRTPPATPHELLESLLVELGLEPYKQSRAERLQAWRQLLVELTATETRVVIAVERANEAATAVLHALDALTAPDLHGCAGANLILMAPDGFRQTLDQAALVGLRQRIRLVRRVRPLDAGGVATYLRAAVERGGAVFDRVFAPDAVDALASHSGGIPRVLNHLADSALALAALRREPVLTGALVHEVAADVYELGHEPAPKADGSDPTARGADVPNVVAPGAEDADAAGNDDGDGFAAPGDGDDLAAPGDGDDLDAHGDEDDLAALGDDMLRVGAVPTTAAEPHADRGAALAATAVDDWLAAHALDDSLTAPALADSPAGTALEDPLAENVFVDPLAETATVELGDEPAWAEDVGSSDPADSAPFAPDAADSTGDAGAGEIPVLTDWIDERSAPSGHDDLDMLDAAETLTLLGDDVDAFAAEISAELLAAEDDTDPDESRAANPSAAAR